MTSLLGSITAKKVTGDALSGGRRQHAFRALRALRADACHGLPGYALPALSGRRLPIASGPHLALLALVLVSIGTNALIAHSMRMGNDSAGYIESARALVQGDLFAGRPGGWFGLKAVIASSLALSGGLEGVLIVQIAFAALAAA